MLEMPDGARRRPRRPDFEAQHRPDRRFPIFDSRQLRGAEVADYTMLSPPALAALAAAYQVEAIACEIMAGRLDPAARAGRSPEVWREVWESAALTARIAAQCCLSRLKPRPGA
jgi:hypothetical protein